MTTAAENFDVQARIARLFIYPVKSCAGLELDEALLTETGFDLDRAWMVVDTDGLFVSQREQPRMALIRPTLKSSELVLRAPGMLALHLRLDAVESAASAQVWDDVVPCYDMGDVAAQWFSDFLAPAPTRDPLTPRPYRLVRFDPEQRRVASTTWTGDIEARQQFSDGFPLLVAGMASLEGLNRRLQAQGHAPVGIDRFRPNIVLDGIDEHDEDRIGTMQVDTGEDAPVLLRPVKPCPRCPIPNVDPQTGTSSPEVGDTLQSYRVDPRVDGGITFGMNTITIEGVDRVLRVGQPVRANYVFD